MTKASDTVLMYKGNHSGSELPKGSFFEEGSYWIHIGGSKEIRGIGKIENGDWLVFYFSGWKIVNSLNKENNTDSIKSKLDWNY